MCVLMCVLVREHVNICRVYLCCEAAIILSLDMVRIAGLKIAARPSRFLVQLIFLSHQSKQFDVCFALTLETVMARGCPRTVKPAKVRTPDTICTQLYMRPYARHQCQIVPLVPQWIALARPFAQHLISLFFLVYFL